MQPGLRSGDSNKSTYLESDENYDLSADEEVINDEDVLNRSYKSTINEAAADFANGSPRNVSSIKSLSLQFLSFSYSYFIWFHCDRTHHLTAVISLTLIRLIFLARTASTTQTTLTTTRTTTWTILTLTRKRAFSTRPLLGSTRMTR